MMEDTIREMDENAIKTIVTADMMELDIEEINSA